MEIPVQINAASEGRNEKGGEMWNTASLLNRPLLMFLSCLVICCYVLLAWVFKLTFYPGWTWRGFLLDLESLLGLGGLLLPVLFFFWKVYAGKSSEDSLMGWLRGGLSLGFAVPLFIMLWLCWFSLKWRGGVFR